MTEKEGRLVGPGLREFSRLLAQSDDIYISKLCQVLSNVEEFPDVRALVSGVCVCMCRVGMYICRVYACLASLAESKVNMTRFVEICFVEICSKC